MESGIQINERHTVLFLFITSVFLLFWNLGGEDIINVNEAQRILPAISMVKTGDWIVPRLDGEPYLTKPPLIYWILAISYLLFGKMTEWSARFPLAITGILTVLLTYEFGKRYYSRRTGFIAGIALLSSYYFIRTSQLAELDGILVLATLFGIYSMFRAEFDGEKKTLWWVLSFFSWGIAFLLKWVVFLMFLIPALILILFLQKKQGRRFEWKSFLIGIGVFLIICIPWCILVFDVVGAKEVFKVLSEQASQRFIKPSKINCGSPFFYFTHTTAAILPWTYLLLYLFAGSFWKIVFHNSKYLKEKFLSLFCAIVFIAFSLIKGKETEYLMPLHPFIFLLCGRVFDLQISGDIPSSKIINTLEIIFFSILGLLALLFPVTLFSSIGDWFKFSKLTLCGVALSPIVGIILLLGTFKLKRGARPILLFIYASFLIVFLLSAYKFRQNQTDSLKEIAALARSKTSDKIPLILFKVKKPNDLFYFLDIPFLRTNNAEMVIHLIKQHKECFLIIQEKHLSDVKDEIAEIKMDVLKIASEKKKFRLIWLRSSES